MQQPLILYNPDLPFLFCKPAEPSDFLFYSKVAHLGQLVCFKSMDIKKHLPQIHRWVNMSYSTTFWQMDGPLEGLECVYQSIQAHPNAHSFVGYYGDELVCQFDVYMIGVDELSFVIAEESVHCGFHLLMAPHKRPVHGLTIAIIRAFLEYYFSFPAALKMFAEPDVRNQKSIQLLKQSGFRFLKTISMSYKAAHLFCLDREDFFNGPTSETAQVLH